MITDEDIKLFVREIVGCDCPEEIFNKIVCEDHVKIDCGLTISHRLNIGSRLLIYVSTLDEASDVRSELLELVDSGEKERKK